MPIIEAVANMYSHGSLGPNEGLVDLLMRADEQAVRDCINLGMSLTDDAEAIKDRKAIYRAQVLDEYGG